MGIHRNLDPLYDFKEKRLVKNLVHDLPLRTSALRTLGAFANVSASESFLNVLVDEWSSIHKTNASGFSFAIWIGKSPLPAIIAIFINAFPFWDVQ